ncbi:hypothetical protein PAPYR_9146 [Paratrimastix pyriformis]|uniref:Uncharacterized protein n=1 Tax=Paratrimastix pyriformis TaxID=342808 RepID=A0ABQ8UDA3_9EUKA|nr:hypothetical protein PAPYR_9146 [Paratrimastix pyriformis]
MSSKQTVECAKPVVITPDNYSVKKLSIKSLSDTVRKQDKPMKMCHLEHSECEMFIETPEIELGPYGVNIYENTKTIRLPVENVGDDFKKLIDRLEKYCENNQDDIIKATFDEDKPDEFEYKSFAKQSDNEMYPSYYKVTVGYADAIYPSVFRKNEKGKIERDESIKTEEDLRKAVPKGSVVKMIISPKIWIDAKGHYGLSASCRQLLIVKEGKHNKDTITESLFSA